MSSRLTPLTLAARGVLRYNCDSEQGRYDRLDSEAPLRSLSRRARVDSDPAQPARYDSEGMKRLTFQAKR